MTIIVELKSGSWFMQLKSIGRGPDFNRLSPNMPDWKIRRERERWLKNKSYDTLAKLPNGKHVRALTLRDVLKTCEPNRLEYAPDRLILYHELGKAELYYQDNR